MPRTFLSVLLAGAACMAGPATQAATAELCPATAERIDAIFAKAVPAESPGMVVAVAVNGRPVLTHAYGTADLEQGAPMTDGAVFRLASITKQFTAAAILLAAEHGDLSLDSPLSTILPGVSRHGGVTLYQLLTHTSGIPDYAGDATLLKNRTVAHTHAEMLAIIDRLEPASLFPPGTGWAYSNSNYYLLGLVLEEVEQRPLAEIFARRLFGPAGLTATAFDEAADVVPQRVAGYRHAAGSYRNAPAISWTIPWAAGGLRTSAADLLRWDHALFAGHLLSPASLALMLAPGRLTDGRTTREAMPADWQAGLRSDYALGLFAGTAQGQAKYWHSGDIDGFSTWLAHYRGAGLTIAVLANSEGAALPTQAIEELLLQPGAFC